MREVLVVVRNYPPTSHVSVERAMKLVKYLNRYGWRPTVLTAAEATVGLAEDPTLLRQVEHVPVLRSATMDLVGRYLTFRAKHRRGARGADAQHVRTFQVRGPWSIKSFLIPDSHLFWAPAAVRTALRAPGRHRWDVVLAMSPPATTMLIARRIARQLGVPFVLDYRDPWTGYYAAPRRLPPLAAFERRLEAKLFGDARAVITTDPLHVAAPARLVPEAARPPVQVIPNGYDEEDFTDVRPLALPAFSIVHTGQLRYTLAPLWAVLARVLERDPSLRGRIHMWQMGLTGPQPKAQLAAPPDGVVTHLVPQGSMHTAIRHMVGADLLFIEGIRDIVSSKAYQYLRAGRPILAQLDGGTALQALIEGLGRGRAFTWNDIEMASGFVLSLARAPRSPPSAPTAEVARYARHEIARSIAEVLTAAVSRPPR